MVLVQVAETALQLVGGHFAPSAWMLSIIGLILVTLYYTLCRNSAWLESWRVPRRGGSSPISMRYVEKYPRCGDKPLGISVVVVKGYPRVRALHVASRKIENTAVPPPQQSEVLLVLAPGCIDQHWVASSPMLQNCSSRNLGPGSSLQRVWGRGSETVKTTLALYVAYSVYFRVRVDLYH